MSQAQAGRMLAASTRLAVYGTLAPGRSNHHQLKDLNGRWSRGRVTGHLVEEGWGADMGCPGLILDVKGPEIDVHLFDSPDLPTHWDRLDAFEGAQYTRALVDVLSDGVLLPAYIYTLTRRSHF